MRNLKVSEIIEITKGKLICGNPSYECCKFSRDTRNINKGDTYIAIKGENFNGNLFWKQALENGADSVIVSDIQFEEQDLHTFENKNIILVEDTLDALYKIASLKRSFYNIPVIAITGSVGKTSTKDIVSNVVSQKYKALKTIGNQNNNIGLPFTILNLQDEEAMVLEMGMNHFGEISLLSNIAKPNICVITNIGTSHIGNLGSRENILKAKLEILDGAENPIIIINNDNDLLHKWQNENKDKNNIITYGIKQSSNIQAMGIELKEESSQFNWKFCKENAFENENTTVKVPVGGEHFIYNALCAIAVGIELNIEIDKIKKGIETFRLTEKRMDTCNLKNGVKIINDAYNASLEAMQASLEYLGKFKNNRKIAVLGDMLELGDYSQKLHEQVGKEVAKNKIDILIGSGDYAKYIIESAKANGMSEDMVHYFKNSQEIVEYLRKIMQSGDIILFKASHGMKFYELAEQIKRECEK